MSSAKQVLGLLAWLALTFLAPLAGNVAGRDAFGFYGQLVQPSWAPPAWLFGPVWTVLYALMAVAAWLVWKRGGWRAPRWPLALYLVQLGLNAAWTPIFFGLRAPGWALADMALLWMAIVATVASFHRAQPLAAWLLAPYLGWVSFAAALNFALWRLNSA